MREEIRILRSDIITKCDQYLNGEIVKDDLVNYAWNLIMNVEYEWEDDIISDIVFAWGNQTIDYSINKVNIGLWKHRLETEENLLADYNSWNVHIEKQKAICIKYNSKWNPINKKLMIGCGVELNSDPIHALRNPKEGYSTGWYIWTGERSNKPDFFELICAEHLLQKRPELIKYLGLDVGYRFVIDGKGCEDIWFDEKLLN